ncbi:uncharacterized protein [Henckelia pumila]|uniref:uncharacterized protein n=1 Tax=Henckelia pumila TaxID=405737 RepID=UPI003C6E5301
MGKKSEALSQNLDCCENLLQEFQKSRMKLDLVTNALNSSGLAGWNAPTPGTLQLEVEACVNDNLQQYGVGGAIKYFTGRILQAFGQRIATPSSVAEGELIAIHEGLKSVHARGLRRCRVVFDSLIYVQGVTKSKEDYHYTGARVYQIKILIDETEMELRHFSCTSKSTAHALALFASCVGT